MNDYLICQGCKYKLAEVGEHKGSWALMLRLKGGGRAILLRGELECPICGARRPFVSAKALGLEEDDGIHRAST